MEYEKLSKCELLNKIMEYKFTINDLALFLDTHPCDEKALKLHNDYSEKLEYYKKLYEKDYGPLTVYNETSSWDKWVYNTWPFDERSEK